jgi:hypothetical protein
MAIFRGAAMFTWTDTDDVTTQRVLLLNEPVREIRPAHDQSVYVGETLSRTARQVFTVGEGVDQLLVRVRYQDDPQGCLDLIKAGAKGRTITYTPDRNDADVSFACYLISPGSPVALGLDTDRGTAFGDLEIDLLLRKTDSTPFAAARDKDVLCEYRAGGRLEEATFTRASVAGYVAIGAAGSYGTASTAASGAIRTSWLSTASSRGPRTFPVLLLEAARTNRALSNRNLNTTNWAWNGTGTVTTGQSDPWGGTNATLLNDASTTVTVERRQTVILTGAGTTRAVVSVLLKPHSTVGTGSFRLYTTNAATTHIRGTVTWSSGIPSVVATVGTLVAQPERYRGGFYRFQVRSTGTLTTGNRFLGFRPASTAVGSKGGLIVTGVQVEQ